LLQKLLKPAIYLYPFYLFCFPPSIICCKALKLYVVTACHAEDGNCCGENYRH